MTIWIGVAGAAVAGVVAVVAAERFPAEFVVAEFVLPELVLPELVAGELLDCDGEALGCADDCLCGPVVVTLRAAVVRRFVVCASDAGESASKRASWSAKGNRLKGCFIREFIVFDRISESFACSYFATWC